MARTHLAQHLLARQQLAGARLENAERGIRLRGSQEGALRVPRHAAHVALAPQLAWHLREAWVRAWVWSACSSSSTLRASTPSCLLLLLLLLLQHTHRAVLGEVQPDILRVACHGQQRAVRAEAERTDGELAAAQVALHLQSTAAQADGLRWSAGAVSGPGVGMS